MRILVGEDDQRLAEPLRRGFVGDGFAVHALVPRLNGFRLRALIRRTKTEALDHVRDHAFGGDIVEVHVSALRRKTDTPFGSRTVRGVGYRLTPGRTPA
ncbi:hypothetical protein [Streptomyces melanogenes]|uniref:hypothetical protein n=1 Tax=Streptomyces melanogenes TaxID=67326 RepID=UPI0037AA3AF8